MMRERRPSPARALMRTSVAALLVWSTLAVLMVARPGNTPGRETGVALLPDFDRDRGRVSSINFLLADDLFSLERRRDGWVMPEAGDYPVDPDRLADLMVGLSRLERETRRTSDPEKLALLGLGDPEDGGNGVRVDLTGPADETLASFILGRRRTGLYLRSPGDNQAFRLAGDLPAFYTRRAWLDLDILSVTPQALRALRLYDSAGQTAYFMRAPGQGPLAFRPAAPHAHDQLRDPAALSRSALALSSLTFTDAKPATGLTTSPVGRHISETFDELELDLQAYRELDGLWVTLRAIEAGNGARRAASLNERTEGWAFRVSSMDFEALTPAVADLVTRPASTGP